MDKSGADNKANQDNPNNPNYQGHQKVFMRNARQSYTGRNSVNLKKMEKHIWRLKGRGWTKGVGVRAELRGTLVSADITMPARSTFMVH